MKILVVYDQNNKNINKYLSKLKESAKNKNIKLFIIPQKDLCETDFKKENFKTALVYGGDGTIINASKYLYKYNINIFGINTGTLGFLSVTDTKDDIKKILDFLSNDYEVIKKSLLDIKIIKDKKEKSFNAINECLICSYEMGCMGKYEVSLKNRFLNEFHSDGIIISTNTGSSAYSFSVNAPIIDDKIDLLILTPIRPHSFGDRSIILSDTEVINVKIKRDNQKIKFDSRQEVILNTGDEVSISLLKNKIKYIKYKDVNYFDKIKNKIKKM